MIAFLIIAAVVYFLIVAPMARITARFAKQAEVTTRDCPECLSTIPIAASRCMYCTVRPRRPRRAGHPDLRAAESAALETGVAPENKSLGSGRGLAVPSPDDLQGPYTPVLSVLHRFLVGSCGDAGNPITGS